MEKFIFSFSIAFAIVAITSCQKDPQEAILPEEVELGASVVYLNGEEAATYLSLAAYDTINRVMNSISSPLK